jgi:PPK2 family polyphosphate:nucleotide phosphotransferase
MLNDKFIHTASMLVKPDEAIDLKNYKTRYSGRLLEKKEAQDLLEESRKKLAKIQDKFFADNRYSVLIILQAMDAAGKDGAVKHIMSGFNPLGVKVHSFKTPTPQELDHDYLWRHTLALPGRGEIAIHNRSHYENVLITRVHPEYLLNENIPGIDSSKDAGSDFWEERFKQINRFEKNCSENGTVILKFFLHLSREEQRKRFLDRIEDPSKNWKFSAADLKERSYWDEYQDAYQDAIRATSKKHAPWFIVPADDKWFTRLAIATIINEHFEELDIHYPAVSEAQKSALEKARRELMEEPKKEGRKTGRKKAK